MAKILIDARESGTSTGRYIDKLIEYLHQLDHQHQIIVATKPHRIAFMHQVAPTFTTVEAPFKEFTFAEQIQFNTFLKRQRADLVHFGKDHQPVGYPGKKVTTMHDLTTMRFINPDKRAAVFKSKQAVYKWLVKRVARDNQHIITPTEYVKQDIIAYTGVPASKISVTLEAADAIADTPEPLEQLVDTQFIMYVGRPTPRKNLERLITAYRELQGSHPHLRLVLAGKLDANYRALQQKTQTEQITNIVYTDFVTDGQLRWLYEHCQAYVFPSLSEGFSLSGLEAMLHGAPVISSDATCLPEVYGDAAHYFDPLDVISIRNAINEVLTDKQLKARLIAAGHDQAAHYSWQRMAEQTLAVYDQVLAG